MDMGILETCGIIAALSAGLGGPIAVVRWVGGTIDEKIGDECRARIEAMKVETARVDARYDHVEHRGRNNSQRLDAIDRDRTITIERMVKTETTVANIKEEISRVNHGIERLSENMTERFDTLAKEIREHRSAV